MKLLSNRATSIGREADTAGDEDREWRPLARASAMDMSGRSRRSGQAGGHVACFATAPRARFAPCRVGVLLWLLMALGCTPLDQHSPSDRGGDGSIPDGGWDAMAGGDGGRGGSGLGGDDQLSSGNGGSGGDDQLSSGNGGSGGDDQLSSGNGGSSGSGGMGGGQMDGGPDDTEDASADGGDADAMPEPEPPTEAVFELGARCYDNGELGCSDFDSALGLLCSSGRWTQSGTCGASQRCDTRLGPTQGQCLSIVAECIDREPFAELCRGNDRITCGPDRVTVEIDPCPSAHVCVLDGDTPDCMPDTDECAEGIDDCDDDPDACRNTLGGYECTCPEGYEGAGVGQDGCTDVVECDTDNGGCDMNPMADCTEVVGAVSTCSCPDGYSGSGFGDNGCIDIDECHDGLAAACGAGATACDNSPGNYSCECGNGFSGTGTQACDNINECSDGAEAACGTGATGCSDSPGSYSCTCGGSYVPADDGKSCRLRQWGTAAQIQADTSPASRIPSVGMDAEGNLVAVWIDGARVWSSRYTRSTDTWSTPEQIVSEHDTNANSVRVAVNASGYAVAVWYQDGTPTRNMYKANFRPSSGWTQGTLLEYEDNIAGQTSSPNAAIGDNGDAIAVWEQSEGGTSDSIRARHYISGSWQDPITLSSTGHVSYPQVAIDGSGRAVAIWQQFISSQNSFRGARYSSGSWGTPVVLELDADQENLATLPCLAMNPSGIAFAIWCQSDGARYNVWANRFNGTSWGSAVRLESIDTGDAGQPSVGVDEDGNAIALFSISDGTRHNMYAARFTAGGSWGSPTLIESENLGDAARPVIGFDSSGNGIAVWHQNDGTRDNIWSNRYVPGSGWGTAATIESTSHTSSFPKLVVHPSGYATAIWASGTPYRDIWANHYR